jgi:hypothetical protein
MWVSGSRPRYVWTSVNVGLFTRAAAWSPRASPATKRVVPAPSGPSSVITSPAASAGANAAPSASVSPVDPERRTSGAASAGSGLTSDAA